MRGFVKGIGLLVVATVVSSVLLALMGGAEEGSALQGIAISLGCLVTYIVAVRIDAIKPMLGVSVYLFLMGVFNLTIGFAGGIFAMVGPAVTMYLAVVRLRGDQ